MAENYSRKLQQKTTAENWTTKLDNVLHKLVFSGTMSWDAVNVTAVKATNVRLV